MYIKDSPISGIGIQVHFNERFKGKGISACPGENTKVVNGNELLDVSKIV
jgi:hypothetical protein